MNQSKPWVVVLGVLAVALTLRLIHLGERAVWYDEAFAVLFSEKGWDAMRDGTLTPVEGSAADVHPLLYYMTLNEWMAVFGQSPAAIRLYSALTGVLTVAAVYGLVHDWFDRKTALVAALITAVAPFHVQYSQEARMYALLGLALMLTTWTYWRAWHRGRIAYWLLFGVLAGISMYVQQLAAFYLAALGTLPLLARDGRRFVKTALAAALALVIYLPWLLYLPGQLGKLRQYWVEKPTLLHVWLAFRSFTSVNLDFPAAWWLPTFLLAAVLIVFLLYRAYPVRRGSHPDRLALGWSLWLAIMPVLFMWAVSRVFQPVFLARALLPSAIALYIALAWLFVRGGMPGPVVAILGGAWAIIIAFGLVTHYTWDTFPNPPFDDAAAYLARHVEAPDVVVHGNKITALPMIYYRRSLPQRYVRDIPGSGSDTLAVPTQHALGLLADESVESAAQSSPRVWYVAFTRLEDEMSALVQRDPSQAAYDSLGWLREHYVEIDTRAFNDLVIILFVTPDMSPQVSD